MKAILLSISFFLLTATACYPQTKAYVDKKTKEFYLVANIRQDHKFFGYSAPDTHSKKLILFSIFTSDVKDNPHKMPLGAYYGTNDLKQGDTISFVSEVGGFVKLNYASPGKPSVPFYVKRTNIVFE